MLRHVERRLLEELIDALEPWLVLTGFRRDQVHTSCNSLDLKACPDDQPGLMLQLSTLSLGDGTGKGRPMVFAAHGVLRLAAPVRGLRITGRYNTSALLEGNLRGEDLFLMTCMQRLQDDGAQGGLLLDQPLEEAHLRVRWLSTELGSASRASQDAARPVWDVPVHLTLQVQTHLPHAEPAPEGPSPNRVEHLPLSWLEGLSPEASQALREHDVHRWGDLLDDVLWSRLEGLQDPVLKAARQAIKLRQRRGHRLRTVKPPPMVAALPARALLQASPGERLALERWLQTRDHVLDVALFATPVVALLSERRQEHVRLGQVLAG